MQIDLSLDQSVAERMGYSDAVAATSFPSGGDDRIEIALVPPLKMPYPNDDWVICVHSGCDPDRPDLGVSSVEDVAGGREAAVQRYAEVLEEIRSGLERDAEIRNLRGYSPM